MALEFWKDRAKKELNLDLFSKVAETSAKAVAEKSTMTMNNPTQLRRFFDEIVTFDSRFKMAIAKASTKEEREVAFKQQLPFVHMLIPKVRYAEARKLVSTEFTTIIKEAIDNLKEPEDIKVFTSFFEAFIGHFKYFKEFQQLSNNYQNTNGGYRGGNNYNGGRNNGGRR